MLASLDLEAERNHIRRVLSAVEKFNSLLGDYLDVILCHPHISGKGR
jgi:hypothetical protein